MRYLEVVNWQRFQHYRDRRPPWIKFYAALLDDRAWGRLQDASKMLLPLLFLLASRCDNCIPWHDDSDKDWVRTCLHLDAMPDVKPLLDKGFLRIVSLDSAMLAERKHGAMPETETETETETEGERERGRKKRRPLPPPLPQD